MLRGSSGFYSYAIYEHLKEWPGFNLGETRIAFKLRKDKYRFYSFFFFLPCGAYFFHMKLERIIRNGMLKTRSNDSF